MTAVQKCVHAVRSHHLFLISFPPPPLLVLPVARLVNGWIMALGVAVRTPAKLRRGERRVRDVEGSSHEKQSGGV